MAPKLAKKRMTTPHAMSTPPSVVSEIEGFVRLANAKEPAHMASATTRRDLAQEILRELRKEVAELDRDAWKVEDTGGGRSNKR